MTDMQLGTFHPFPLLPKELRLEIWKLALPDPRVIELSLLRSDYPLRLPQRYYRASRGAWWWVATASPTTFPLIRTNAEARSIALASYERCEILNRNDTVRHPMYINFSKDTIFVTRDVVHDLKEVLVKSHRRVRFMNWRMKVRNLALPLDILERPGYFRAALIPGPEPADPKGFEEATRYIADIVRTFPGLKDLSFVIDGRNPGFGGDAEIIDSTSEQEDYEEPEGRALASSWIPEVLAGLAPESPDVGLPSVHLALLINGRDTPALERRWNYLRACCRVCHPDSPPEPIHPYAGVSRFFRAYSSSESSSSDDDLDDLTIAEEQEDETAGSGHASDTGSQHSSTVAQKFTGCRLGQEYSSSSDEEGGRHYAYPSLQTERGWSHFRASLL